MDIKSTRGRNSREKKVVPNKGRLGLGWHKSELPPKRQQAAHCWPWRGLTPRWRVKLMPMWTGHRYSHGQSSAALDAWAWNLTRRGELSCVALCGLPISPIILASTRISLLLNPNIPNHGLHGMVGHLVRGCHRAIGGVERRASVGTPSAACHQQSSLSSNVRIDN